MSWLGVCFLVLAFQAGAIGILGVALWKLDGRLRSFEDRGLPLLERSADLAEKSAAVLRLRISERMVELEKRLQTRDEHAAAASKAILERLAVIEGADVIEQINRRLDRVEQRGGGDAISILAHMEDEAVAEASDQPDEDAGRPSGVTRGMVQDLERRVYRMEKTHQTGTLGALSDRVAALEQKARGVLDDQDDSAADLPAHDETAP